MNTLLITYSNPKPLPDGVKLFPVAAANAELTEHPKPRPLCTIEEIRLRVETMTPLLKDLLDFRPPEHWGIND